MRSGGDKTGHEDIPSVADAPAPLATRGALRWAGDYVDMFADANSIFLPDGKIDIPLPAVILSAVELLRRDSDSLCSSLLRSSIPLRSTQNDIGAKAQGSDTSAAGGR